MIKNNTCPDICSKKVAKVSSIFNISRHNIFFGKNPGFFGNYPNWLVGVWITFMWHHGMFKLYSFAKLCRMDSIDVSPQCTSIPGKALAGMAIGDLWASILMLSMLVWFCPVIEAVAANMLAWIRATLINHGKCCTAIPVVFPQVASKWCQQRKNVWTHNKKDTPQKSQERSPTMLLPSCILPPLELDFINHPLFLWCRGVIVLVPPEVLGGI